MHTAVITQPTYLPWLGYFEQMAQAETFVFLDSVQFARRSWQSRNRLRDARGEVIWLTVPVAKQSRETPIHEIRISPHDTKWRDEHLHYIRQHLSKAPFFHLLFPQVEAWLRTDFELLADLNIAGIKLFAEWLELKPKFLRATELNPTGTKTALLVGLCEQVGADRYYSALGSKEYMESELFAEKGIALDYQETWSPPEYTQPGEGFVSHLAASTC